MQVGMTENPAALLWVTVVRGEHGHVLAIPEEEMCWCETCRKKNWQRQVLGLIPQVLICCFQQYNNCPRCIRGEQITWKRSVGETRVFTC